MGLLFNTIITERNQHSPRPTAAYRLTGSSWFSRFSNPQSSPLNFMQPEAIDLSRHAPNSTNCSERANTSQYGFHANQLHCAGLCVCCSDESAAHAGSRVPDGVEPRAAEDGELQEQLGRLNLDNSNETKGTRPKPSFQRISEYENALLPSPRKQNEGPRFTIIKKQSNTLHGPQLENFPNGNYPSPHAPQY
jgi:hypothetical protein